MVYTGGMIEPVSPEYGKNPLLLETAAVYLDCNATAPVEPRVRDEVVRYLEIEYGNAGSRTHERGNRAKQAVQRAREQVASLVDAQSDEVIFTSGATESDNLAILGIAKSTEAEQRRHVVSTEIEHKAIIEPLEHLSRQGFAVDLAPTREDGSVDPTEVLQRVRDDTLLVSIMQVNNETGMIQPISAVAEALADNPTYLHVDAAQGFGKIVEPLQNHRIDLISISGHKCYGPKGVGALIARRRGFSALPLTPLMYGGGQERGLRPGTLPVHLIVGLGLAAELASREHKKWEAVNLDFRNRLLEHLAPLRPIINGDLGRVAPNAVNLSIPGVDAEAAMVALKGIIEISNGSACTSEKYEPSHVLKAMKLGGERISGALRISWCHLTEEPDWERIVASLSQLAQGSK